MLTLSEETETLARRVAEAQKLSVDEAVRRALERQARGIEVTNPTASGRVSDEEVARRLAVIREFQQKFKALPTLDPRPVEEIFDEVNES